MSVKVHVEDYMAALTFVVKNNPIYGGDREKAQTALDSLIRSCVADKDTISVKSGGFYVSRVAEHEGHGPQVDIYVTPSTGAETWTCIEVAL